VGAALCGRGLSCRSARQGGQCASAGTGHRARAHTIGRRQLQLRAQPFILIAGQLSGVEGYTESIASGLLAGRYAASLARGIAPTPAPRGSANGSLIHYITHAESKRFQPANITFDLLLPLEEELRRKIRDKKERHRIQCERAITAWNDWLQAGQATH